MGLATALLAGFSIFGVALVAVTEQVTRERIAANERAYTLRSLDEILPPESRNNEMFTDTITVTDPELLGSDQPVTVYRARLDGRPVAAILRITTPNGYSGPIRLLVGIFDDGRVAGVRVVGHRETPGLGDAIESDRSDWILDFAGRSLGDPPEAGWSVKRDGGVFDQFTGATITPRAVTRAVRDALIYFRTHRDDLFAAPPEEHEP
jgi:electron transport complex protein RnfG